MLKNKLWVVACAVAVMSVAGCENRSADNTRSDLNRDTAAQRGEQEKVTGVQTDELNQNAKEEGSADVQVQKEVTRTITSEEKVPTVIEGQTKLDINRMSEGDWQGLGFPESTAKSIIQYREQRNGFKSVDELSQVPGMNQQLLAPLRNKLGLTHKQ